VDLSGIIFVVLAVAWAVYLIPKALKHHDEVARTRSIDRFSTAMRVLARREPVSHRDARLVVTTKASSRGRLPAGRTAPAPVLDAVTAVAAPVSRARLDARRTAAKVAARRRRRVLTGLLLCIALTAGAGYLSYLPWWSLAVPGALTVLWLVLCRTQVRRETLRDFDLIAGKDAPTEHPSSAEAVVVLPRRAVRVEVAEGTPRDLAAEQAHEPVEVTVRADGVGELDEGEDTIGLDVALLDAVVVPTEDGGTLWDPLPMTLPTYVSKPQARRTVRTIELGEPGTWTSGRTPQDAALVARAKDDEQAPEDGSGGADEQRAVGS